MESTHGKVCIEPMNLYDIRVDKSSRFTNRFSLVKSEMLHFALLVSVQLSKMCIVLLANLNSILIKLSLTSGIEGPRHSVVTTGVYQDQEQEFVTLRNI